FRRQNESYTRDLCLELCVQWMIASKPECNCSQAAVYGNVSRCLSYRYQGCSLGIFKNGTILPAYMAQCSRNREQCPVECSTVTLITTSLSQARFPSPWYAQVLLQQSWFTQRFPPGTLMSSKDNLTLIQSSTLALHVAYESLQSMLIDERA